MGASRRSDRAQSSPRDTRTPSASTAAGARYSRASRTRTRTSRVCWRAGSYEDLSPSHTPPFAGGLAPLPLPTLTPAEERVMALLGALEAIRSGTTLVLEE